MHLGQWTQSMQNGRGVVAARGVNAALMAALSDTEQVPAEQACLGSKTTVFMSAGE